MTEKYSRDRKGGSRYSRWCVFEIAGQISTRRIVNNEETKTFVRDNETLLYV